MFVHDFVLFVLSVDFVCFFDMMWCNGVTWLCTLRGYSTVCVFSFIFYCLPLRNTYSMAIIVDVIGLLLFFPFCTHWLAFPLSFLHSSLIPLPSPSYYCSFLSFWRWICCQFHTWTCFVVWIYIMKWPFTILSSHIKSFTTWPTLEPHGASSPSASRRISSGSTLKSQAGPISTLSVASSSAGRDKNRSPDRGGRGSFCRGVARDSTAARPSRKHLPIINPLVSLPMWPSRLILEVVATFQLLYSMSMCGLFSNFMHGNPVGIV